MEYEIIYSKRKTLSLCIKNSKLIVRAPFGTPSRVISESVLKHRRWIEKTIERAMRFESQIQNLTENDIDRLKKEAKTLLTQKTEYFAQIMGVKPRRVTITSAMTRFGSCSASGNVCYSYRLMLYPEAAIDYVVVHELSHLIEMNHSVRFWNIVKKYLPDYKHRESLLKQ